MGEEKIMKLSAFFLGTALAAGYSTQNEDCGYTKMINDQIVAEMEASLAYQAMHYHFSTQERSRPNFAKMLASRAAEERDHANVLADFQLKRGYGVDLSGLSFNDRDQTGISQLTTVREALKKMIITEKNITQKLKTLNKIAEDGLKNSQGKVGKACKDALIDETTCQAPHLADLMSGTYLPEQLADINELQVLLNQLDQFTKGMSASESLEAELMFDRLILKD